MQHTQTWHPDRYANNAGFVAELGLPVVDLLDPQPGEHILDLGCGDGVLTEKLAALGCAVIGVDFSAEQIAAAQGRGLNARVVDAHSLNFTSQFDAVFSNAALHWMKHPQAVIAGVWRALKAGGRFVGELGGQGNVATVRNALHRALKQRGLDPTAYDPWFFPAPAEYQHMLTAQGFEVTFMELIPRPTPLPGDISGWLETFGESFIFALPLAARAEFINEIREAIRPQLCDSQGHWTVDYVRLRFAAHKPE